MYCSTLHLSSTFTSRPMDQHPRSSEASNASKDHSKSRDVRLSASMAAIGAVDETIASVDQRVQTAANRPTLEELNPNPPRQRAQTLPSQHLMSLSAFIPRAKESFSTIQSASPRLPFASASGQCILPVPPTFVLQPDMPPTGTTHLPRENDPPCMASEDFIDPDAAADASTLSTVSSPSRRESITSAVEQQDWACLFCDNKTTPLVMIIFLRNRH